MSPTNRNEPDEMGKPSGGDIPSLAERFEAMAREGGPASPVNVRTTISLSTSLLAAAKEKAIERESSLSAQLALWIRQKLNARENARPSMEGRAGA